MKHILNFFRKVASLFRSGAVQTALTQVAGVVADALPYIDIASQIVVGLTPTGVDDAAFAMLRRRFPRLFDGSIQSGDELKAYALMVATELLKIQIPGLSTTIARSAVQIAYLTQTADPAKPATLIGPTSSPLRVFNSPPSTRAGQ